MKVVMQCCFVVNRLPAKFHRIRSLFDSPTDNYSDNIVGQTSDVFGLRKRLSGYLLSSPLSPSPSTHAITYRQAQLNLSRQPAALLARTSESCPGPDPGGRHRWVRIIPKHLQNITVFFFGLPSLFFPPYDFERRDEIAPNLILLSLYIVKP